MNFRFLPPAMRELKEAARIPSYSRRRIRAALAASASLSSAA